MKEHTLAFGLNKALIGTICLPSTAQSSGIGVIFFNAGVVHRIGPHRIHVRLARALAAKGISSIRFDLSGQGDSARPVMPNAFEMQVEMDVQAAMQALGDATGLTQFALFGFCSGAYQGFPIALADARLTGLLMYDAFLYPTMRSRLNRYGLRIKQHGLVKAVGRFAWREIAALAARLMPGAHGTGKGQPVVDEGFFTELPTKPVFAAGLGKLVSRGVKVGLIFTGGTFERYNYAGQFSEAFAGLDIVDKLTLHYFPDMDHLVSAIAAQVELIEYIERWMVDLNVASRAVSTAAEQRPPGVVMISRRFRITMFLAALFAALLGSLALAPVREFVHRLVPLRWIVQFNGLRFGFDADYDIRIRMADGVELGSTLYLPRNRSEKLATVFVQLPYNRLTYSEGLYAGDFFARHGYAVMVQDIRGKYSSGGEFIPYGSSTSDGAATLDWIVKQPWSNGRVGTFGCSALGELQFALAKARHPAHAAMLPLGAGGAVGSVGGRYAYFGVFEGGVFQLASGFGWFLNNGAKDPHARPPKNIDMQAALRGLPVVDLVKRLTPAPNGYDEFVSKPLTDPWWQTLGYVSDADLPTIPALVINTWGDQTVGDALYLAEAVRKISPEIARNQHVIIGPGIHCESAETAVSGKFGDLEVQGAAQPYNDWYLRWFDYWLRDKGNGLADLPAYLYYVIGENRWLTAASWPPEGARIERWYLDSGGHANGRRGDGILSRSLPQLSAHDEFRYDPMNPVATRGGPLCCSGNPADRAGPVDQGDVEARDDVLVYTTAVLQEPLRIAGPVRATLNISSSARDTDFVARLVHVWPDGRATNIQEGALRARYRNGIDRPSLLQPGQPVALTVDMRSIAYLIPQGHRLRLHITSSSFPRLERNLNTGGRNYDETVGIVAINRVHHDKLLSSFVELPVLP